MESTCTGLCSNKTLYFTSRLRTFLKYALTYFKIIWPHLFNSLILCVFQKNPFISVFRVTWHIPQNCNFLVSSKKTEEKNQKEQKPT